MPKSKGVTGGRRKAVERLLPKIAFGEPHVLGPFTVIFGTISPKDQPTGRQICGWGQARRNPADREDYDIGLTIAKYRAATAILMRIEGKEPRHPLMG